MTTESKSKPGLAGLIKLTGPHKRKMIFSGLFSILAQGFGIVPFIHYEFDYGYMLAEANRELEGETYAIFANLTYPITTQLNLVTGLRYESEKKEFADNNMHLDLDDSWDQLIPKIALEYTFTPGIMTYMSISQGYRAGGFNALAVLNAQYLDYDAETCGLMKLGQKPLFWIINS